MRRHLGTLAALALGAAALTARGQAGDKEEFAKAVAAQKQAAVDGWKRAFEKEDPSHHETEHFLLYGKAADKTLKDVGAYLERVRAAAWKALELGKDRPWPGKMSVFLIPDKRDYRAAVRAVARRLPEKDERGRFAYKTDTPHVLAGPGDEAHELPVDLQAGAQLAAALVLVKGGETVPEWIVEGFGRASAFRAAPAALQAAERRRAFAVAVTNKRAAKDAWTSGGLRGDEAPVLRGSLIDYLVYSGRSARFLPILMGFRPQENQPNPTTEMALMSANVAPDRLNEVWQKWVRATK